MDKPCENWNGEHHEAGEHKDSLEECSVCLQVFCGPCREAITGKKEVCPNCKNLIALNRPQ